MKLEVAQSPPEPSVWVDVHEPKKAWEALRKNGWLQRALAEVCAWGLVDGFRIHHQEPGLYSWWDYRSGGWRLNHGLRIDLLLLSPQAADRLHPDLADLGAQAELATERAPGMLATSNRTWPSLVASTRTRSADTPGRSTTTSTEESVWRTSSGG